ncbi:MAG: hypothetical protein IJD97_05630 [Clostridia bacterium]|nr:hypothetical protein [Clostridia bacterium]
MLTNGMDTQFNIISYAILSDKYSKGESMLESFVPLFERLLFQIEGDTVSIANFAQLYKANFGNDIDMPLLGQSITYLENQNKVTKLKGESLEIHKENLIDYDEPYYESLEVLKQELERYLKPVRNPAYSEPAINYLLRFICENAIEVNSYFNYKSNLENVKHTDEPYEERIISFFLEERGKNSISYKLIQEIYSGVVMASVVTTGDVRVGDNPYNIDNVLIDSSFIFRLLDLQTHYEYEAAQSTYKSLKSKGCNFWVLPGTLQQVVKTIQAFSRKYSPTIGKVINPYGDIRFSGIGSAVIRRNLDTINLNQIIETFADELKEKYGVSEFTEFDVPYEELPCHDLNSLGTYKNRDGESVEHDIRLIETIKRLRSKYVYLSQKASWWVLTDDVKLTKWCSRKKEDHEIPECITEAQISTLFWLNEPQNIANESFYNMVLSLRNKYLIDDDEFMRISGIIDTQKKKYESNESKMDRLAMTFNPRSMSLEELLSLTDDAADEYIAEKMSKADQVYAESEEKDKKIEELSSLATGYLEKSELGEKRIEELSEELAVSKKQKADENKRYNESLCNEKKERKKLLCDKKKSIEKEYKHVKLKYKLQLCIPLLIGLTIVAGLIFWIETKVDCAKFISIHGISISLVATILALALIAFVGTHDKVKLYKIVLNKYTQSRVNKAVAFRKIPDYEKEIADLDKQINQLSKEIDNLCQY